ncbi:MAG: TlpA family protein disulfide reductase [Methylobacillus sp.]|jgi:thiol-disulfide isomerase/thioredoxin|nr:TlpA family protein disulfide reductase [Methylobacillus sp.]
MRAGFRLLISALALGAAIFIVYRQLAPNPAVAALYAVTLPDQNGQPQALAQWRDKIVLVNFWATWCPPCREEMPELSEFQEKYRARNVIVLGIATDDVAKISEYSKTRPVQYPLLAGDFQAMTLAETLGNNKGALPYSVLIDPKKGITHIYFGRINIKQLEQDVREIAE